MIPEKLKEEIDRLPLTDKLLLVGDIWDSIAAGNNELPLTDAQKAELDKRYRDYQAGKLSLYDWEGVHEQLREKYEK